jgi:hypothetical protein
MSIKHALCLAVATVVAIPQLSTSANAGGCASTSGARGTASTAGTVGSATTSGFGPNKNLSDVTATPDYLFAEANRNTLSTHACRNSQGSATGPKREWNPPFGLN